MVILLKNTKMNTILTEVQIKRFNAVLTLYELVQQWDENNYCDKDFLLDKYLRRLQGLSERSAGKAPYLWLK